MLKYNSFILFFIYLYLWPLHLLQAFSCDYVRTHVRTHEFTPFMAWTIMRAQYTLIVWSRTQQEITCSKPGAARLGKYLNFIEDHSQMVLLLRSPGLFGKSWIQGEKRACNAPEIAGLIAYIRRNRIHVYHPWSIEKNNKFNQPVNILQLGRGLFSIQKTCIVKLISL